MKNITRRQLLQTSLLLGGGLFLPRSVMAISKDEIVLNPFVRPNLHRDDYWGDIDWNELTTKEERDEFVKDVLLDDKTDEREWIEGEFISGNFSTQLHLNTFGFKKFDESHNDISEKFGITKLGYYNIPLYRMSIISPGWNHGTNAILMGDEDNGNPRIWDNWLKIEPQTDEIVDIGSQSIPEDCDDVKINRVYAFSSFGLGTIPLLRFKIENGTPSLIEDSVNPNLVLERPAPVYVEEDKSKPEAFNVLKQNYPNPLNDSTIIEYILEKPGNVSLTIYGGNGQTLERIVGNQHQTSGKHIYEWDASKYASGQFYAVIEGEGFNPNGISIKMNLVK